MMNIILKRSFHIFFVLCLLFLGLTVIPAISEAKFEDRVRGRILLQVEENGEAWYVHPGDYVRHYLGRPADAFRVMREQSVGVSNTDLVRLLGQVPETSETYDAVHTGMAERLAGQILLKVEGNGEAYYLAPHDFKAYYLGRPADAFRVMRNVGLGVKNNDLHKVPLSEMSSVLISPTEAPELVDPEPLSEDYALARSPLSIVDSTPVITYDITDMARVVRITPPGTIMPDGDVKTHSFVWTDGSIVPVYAPIDMTLAAGSYYQEGGLNQYLLFFDVNDDVEVKFDHIHDPVDAIKSALPQTAKIDDSRTTYTEPISFKAGDVVGYTSGNPASSNWDFGLYIRTSKNYLQENPRFADTNTYVYAVCPYDYFISEKRATYQNLFASVGGQSPPTTFCR